MTYHKHFCTLMKILQVNILFKKIFAALTTSQVIRETDQVQIHEVSDQSEESNLTVLLNVYRQLHEGLQPLEAALKT